jgi:hypothetical protein
VKKAAAWWPCVLLILACGCGKKGPPLPPLVLLPAAPGDVRVARLASTVIVGFTIPAANADGSTPADLAQVDVYAFDGPEPSSPGDIVAQGVLVGSVIVNPPIDPNASPAEVDAARAAAPPGGLDPGATARVSDELTLPADVPDAVRTYMAVGVNSRGRRGVASERRVVPLVPAPAAPAAPGVSYDEQAVTLSWAAPEAGLPVHVYRLDRDGGPMTEEPIAETSFVDPQIVWDAERCYVLRTVTTTGGVPIESPPSPPACVTPTDHFPPPAPAGLQAIAGDGAISLIWDPSDAPDLAGYIVLRAVAPQVDPEPISQALTTDTTFRDTVPAGARVSYAVQAVDQAGNRSPLSNRAEEIAR